MTLTTIIARAESAYPRVFTGEPDAVTAFAVTELRSVFNPKAMDAANIAMAVGALQRASDRLAGMAHAVSDLARPELAA